MRLVLTLQYNCMIIFIVIKICFLKYIKTSNNIEFCYTRLIKKKTTLKVGVTYTTNKPQDIKLLNKTSK